MNVQTIQPRRVSQRLGAFTAGLVAALALVAANGGHAVAAPPEVLASENPVVVPWNQTSKNITLNWNLGNVAPKGTLVVKDNAQTVVLNQALGAVTGSAPLTAVYGKSYTAQLYTAANPPATLGSPLTITTTHPANDPNAVCNTDFCINSTTFSPHGTYAPFTVKTSKPAHFEMQASTDAPLADGSFAHVDSAIFNLSNVTQWNSQLLNLEPNTTYHYMVKATAVNGQVVKKYGTFKTLKRRAEVTFTSLHMVDDSDILSACDCYFHYQAGGQPVVSSDFMYVGSGETIYPNVKFTIYPANSTNSILVRVSAVDDDYDPPFDFCAWGFGPYWSNGSNNCLDYSFVAKWVDVSLSGMEDSKADTYTLTADDGPIKFTASVYVKVSYVP